MICINTIQTLSLYVNDSAGLSVEILKEIDWKIYFLIHVDLARGIFGYWRMMLYIQKGLYVVISTSFIIVKYSYNHALIGECSRIGSLCLD